ncbi:NAD(P)-dependent oxidoreductase [Chitinophaga silvatica]|uniref:NAD(P)-dependent oxidoreductase n=1 Tax=Chitinophaga silvatica TaxID=2282649 RepID=A0A3E1YG34_9BACT|nr:NAD(P)-dependent oxidoreductase [Chitinophaga silvatica]RFS26357.1 NAD(P)-dependent oxidoreductase [Chitinophaga silvatica]
MIAFLGMGLLGSNFVKALLNKGEQVRVWNRTAEKATALEIFGAQAFADVADAVKGATRVHLTLKDDQSVDEVLAAAHAGLQPGTYIVDHTTTSREGAEQRTREWKERGFIYLHAPVFMGPQNALESSGYMLVSGDQTVINTLQTSLEAMTGQLVNLGAENGKAAAMKLVGNSFLVCLTAGLIETLTVAKSLNVTPEDLSTLLQVWNPGAGVAGRLKRITSGSYEQPSWELSMSRKDTQLFLNAAKKAGHQLILLPEIAKQMDKWIDKGFGNHDWTIIGKDSI